MSWQSTPLRGFRISARRPGRSPNGNGRRKQRVEMRMRGELDRGLEPLAMGERRAVRWRHLADLARHDLEAAAVERAAERHRHGPRPVPAQLEDGRFVGRDVERGAQVPRPWRWRERQNRNRPAHRPGVAKPRRSARASSARAGSMSISVTVAPSTRAQRNPTSAPTTPAPTTAMRPDGPGAASQVALSAVSTLAASTARDSGISPGHRQHGLGRNVEFGLVGMQREDVAADAAPPARPRLRRPRHSHISPGTGTGPP